MSQQKQQRKCSLCAKLQVCLCSLPAVCMRLYKQAVYILFSIAHIKNTLLYLLELSQCKRNWKNGKDGHIHYAIGTVTIQFTEVNCIFKMKGFLRRALLPILMFLSSSFRF